jgi:hypothetical protein
VRARERRLSLCWLTTNTKVKFRKRQMYGRAGFAPVRRPIPLAQADHPDRASCAGAARLDVERGRTDRSWIRWSPMASANETPATFQPLPGRTVDRSAVYHALLRALLDLVGVEHPDVDEPDDARRWRHRARRSIGQTVARRAKHPTGTDGVPDQWLAPLIRAAVHEPDPSFNRQLVEPAIAAFGRRRVQLALLAHLDTGAPADAAGAARGWYWTAVGIRYLPGTTTMTPQSAAEHEAISDLRERYRRTALRRFLADDDLDLRRCILPGLTLDPQMYPSHMRDHVAQAVQIARTSNDDYLRHRVEIQVAPGR